MVSAVKLSQIAGQFRLPGPIESIKELGPGNVNDTYLITSAGNQGRAVLQRLNPQVFPEPRLIMENLRTVSGHMVRRLSVEDVLENGARWEIVRIISARNGSDYVVDRSDNCWRALSYIDDAYCPPLVATEELAGEAGRALGRFHRLLSDLDPALLHVILPGFHVTPGYLQRYDTVKDAPSGPPRRPENDYCRAFIEARRNTANVLEEARLAGRLAVRVIHGDPKIENIMIDRRTGRAIGLIDLDTVQPGLIHYDLGDCLRSCCNRLGEETTEFDQVVFDLSLCRALLEGYCSEAAVFLRDADYEYIYDAVRLIAFELGLRFFTDYLAGDRYFKITRPDQNLARALVQFALTESIEDQEAAIRQLIAQCRNVISDDPVQQVYGCLDAGKSTDELMQLLRDEKENTLT